VFEDFVTAALREAFRPYGGELVAQYASTLDVDGTVKIAPDLVWLVDGEVRACIDVKYKVEKHGQYPNADLYQMAAYCRRFGLGEGWLVYAAGSGLVESVRVVEGPNVTRTFVALDVNGAELVTQSDRLAARVAHSVCPVLPLR
jgi:5-methylcytosine-specific restriction enzyme subunit McrC